MSGAARVLRMSHACSVKLVAELNALGMRPLLKTRSGGEAGGGATLNDDARLLLAAYDAMQAEIMSAARPFARMTRFYARA